MSTPNPTEEDSGMSESQAMKDIIEEGNQSSTQIGI